MKINAVKNSIGTSFPNAITGEKMSNPQNIHMCIKLNCNEVNYLKNVAQDRYGKASISLLAKKLLQELVQPKAHTEPVYQENVSDNPRFTVSWLPRQYRYLSKKATLQGDSLSSVVRDIVQEYITNNPVLNNDEVQALYQSNYQLLRIGRNINQLARQFNAILPQSITTEQLNELADFLERHTEQVGKILRKQYKTFKYRPIRALNHETTK